MGVVNYFTDPLVSSQMWGTIFMCLASSLIGVLAFVRRESLVGETLSHAAFPGAVVGAIWGAGFFSILGAFIFSLLGFFFMRWMKRIGVKEDSALCFTLASFMGLGVVMASVMQSTHPQWYRRALTFFYGQAATLMPIHVALYIGLTIGVVLFIVWKFPILKMVNFDRTFSKSVGIATWRLHLGLIFLIALAVVIGIKAVGVVLMSGMVIAPAIVARSFTHRLSKMLVLAGIVGILSALIGNIISIQAKQNLPTGPIILLVAAAFSLFGLLFAPGKGVIYRAFRIRRYQKRVVEENFVKGFWKSGIDKKYTVDQLVKKRGLSRWKCHLLLLWLKKRREVVYENGVWQLTYKGKKRAARIVRVHRLFELYLSSRINTKASQVHAIAEEMEHLISPQMERELTEVLQNPKSDPHSQPIPDGGSI